MPIDSKNIVWDETPANTDIVWDEAPVPQEEPTMLDELGRQLGLTARGAISGVAAPASMVIDPFVNLSNQYLGTNIQPSREALQQMMTQAGLPEPSNTLERAVQTGVEAMTGTGAEAALAKGGSQLLAPLAEKLGTQIGVAGVSAPVAQAVTETTSERSGTPLAVAAGMAAGLLSGGLTAKAIKLGQPIPKTITIEDVQNKARQSYKAVKDAGISVKPDSARSVLLKTADDLKEFNFNPVLNEAHKPIESILKGFETLSKVGTPIKFETLEQFRQAASDLTVPGKDPVTKLLARRVVQTIDEYMSKLKPTDVALGENPKEAVKALTEARRNWKVAARAQVLEDVLDVADAKALDPKASQNELIRRGLINLIANKKRMALFTPDEQAAMRKAASGGTKDALLSLVSRFNPARSQITAAGTAGYAMVDPLTAAATATTGFAADKLQQAYRLKQMQELTSGVLQGNIPKPQIPVAGARGAISTIQGVSNAEENP